LTGIHLCHTCSCQKPWIENAWWAGAAEVLPCVTREGRRVQLVDPRRRQAGGGRRQQQQRATVPAEVIRGRAINSVTGEKSRFLLAEDSEDALGSVEELALQHYASPIGGGWQGVHDEGDVLRTLFGLTLWPAIWDETVRVVFESTADLRQSAVCHFQRRFGDSLCI
jgi:hypothetical protein